MEREIKREENERKAPREEGYVSYVYIDWELGITRPAESPSPVELPMQPEDEQQPHE